MRDAMPYTQQDSVSDAVEAMGWGRDEPLFQCTAYKATRISDIVCKRTVTLFRDRITTTHQDLSGEKCWYLDRNCKLEPEYVEEIAAPEKRSVRPPGTWTVTAKLGTVTGSGQPIDLFCITIHWPTSWLATRGYTSFAVGFETAQDAALWHAHVQQQISCLRLRASKGDISTGHSSKPSYDDRSVAWSGGVAIMRKPSQDKGFVTAALESWLGSKEEKSAVLSDAGAAQVQSVQYRMPTSPVQVPIPSRQNSLHEAGCEKGVAQGAGLADVKAGNASGFSVDVSDGSFSSQYTDTCFPTASYNEQRWVPYRHTNGVAIYHHKESKCAVVTGCSNEAEEPGSEYMASSIVKGSPDECLAVLMNMSSNTTILGPASRFVLLEEGDERQVLRFTVEATGMARHMCAPREVVLERMFKREECGVDVILFNSCQPPVSSTCSRTGNKLAASVANLHTAKGSSRNWQRSSNAWLVGSAVAAGAVALLQGLTAGAMIVHTLIGLLVLVAVVWFVYSASLGNHGHGGVSNSRSCSRSSSTLNYAQRTWHDWLSCVAAGGALWYRPVLATVQGGYTISPREDCGGVNSPECLVTCILKVDLGGCLGERSWLRPFAAALGWVDAYIERMLMAVILVKDEVEQRRFLVQPFSMLTGTVGPSVGDGVASSISGARHGSQAAATASRRNSKRYQQQGMADLGGQHPPIDRRMAYPRSGPAQGFTSVASGSEYSAVLQQQQASMGTAAEFELQHIPGSAADLARHSSRMQRKQKGALGRMASRIYALRPRILGGGERTGPSASPSYAPAPLYKDSISFNSHITARHSPAAAYPEPCLDSAAANAGRAAALDTSDPRQLLASVGLPADTLVVEPSYYIGGPRGPAASDSTLDTRFWSELHTPGTPAPFKLRGSTYLEDRNKVEGGTPQFVLGSVDLVETPGPTQHISRFLPAVRGNKAAYSFVVNLIIPGTPVLSLVAVFINEHHPDILDAPQTRGDTRGADQPVLTRSSGISDSSTSAVDKFGDSVTDMSQRTQSVGSSYLVAEDSRYSNRDISGDDGTTAPSTVNDSDAVGGAEYQRPSDTSDWQPFDYALHRFLHGGDDTRTSMFKLIPHIAEGSWVIKQSVGTVPVILGNKLKTVYYQTDRYIEACVDVTSSSAAAYITGMVRGATKSLVIDLGFVLEGQQAEELPEALLGAFRLNYLDCTTAKKIDTSRELPLLPRPLQHHQLFALQQQAQQEPPGAVGNNSTTAPGVSSGVCESAAMSTSLQGLSADPSNGSPSAAKLAQQQAGDTAEQQPAANALYLKQLAQQLQQRCRNSWGAVDSSRTMTGHARSRSATSVEELISSSNSPRSLPVLSSRLQHRHMSTANCTNDVTATSDPAQRQVMGFSGGVSATVAESAHATSLRPEPGCYASTSNLTTGLSTVGYVGEADDGSMGPFADSRVNAVVSDAPVGSSSAASAAGGTTSNPSPLTPAKQLLSSLLHFAGSEKGLAGRSAATAGSYSAMPQPYAADAAYGNLGVSAAASQQHGQGSCLLPASSGVHMSSSPSPAGTLAAGGAGSLSGAVASAGSLTGRINNAGVIANLTQRGNHHRSSSNSEGRGPAAMSPGSPPAAGDAAKMSAAAYISRAHASALASSAQRRTQQLQHEQDHQRSTQATDLVNNPLESNCHVDAREHSGSMSSSTATAYLSVSPSSASVLHGQNASGGSASHCKRTSSGGHSAAAAKAVRASLPDSALAAGMFASGVIWNTTGSALSVDSEPSLPPKLSAAEQLRVTHRRGIRSSSLSGCQQDAHDSHNSSSSLPASSGSATGVKHGGGSGSMGAAGAGRGVVSQQQAQALHAQQQPKRRLGHRRIASMGAY